MSDTTPIPPASERERFEAWAIEHHEDVPQWTGSRYRQDVWEDLWIAWQARAALSHPSTPQGWQPIEPLDLNVFAEICHNAHIDFALDKFPSYERAIEHHYIWMLNAINAQRPPEQGGKG